VNKIGGTFDPGSYLDEILQAALNSTLILLV